MLAWECAENYERLRFDLIDELKPVGELEHILVEHIIAKVWEWQRCQFLKTGLLAGATVALALKLDTDGDLFPYDVSELIPRRATRPLSSESSPPRPIYQPSTAEEAVAIFGMPKDDPLERIERTERHITDMLYSLRDKLNQLQQKRPSSIPRAALDVSYLDICDEIERRQRRRENRNAKKGKR